MTAPPITLPRVGMLATVRNRRGIVTSVEPFDAGPEGRLHLTTIEYADGDGHVEDRVLWEREPGASVLEPAAMPDVLGGMPMRGDELDALVRATRWTALTPFLDPDGEGGPLSRLPIASPLHGAIQAEDYQLVPLLKALRMPRVSLLIADDVGLGKTVEAGLILSELLIRRRVRRVLVLCPASLRTQWRDELLDKFALPFAEVDRTETLMLRRRLGMDANPWRVHPRIVSSYHYLKQPDVLEQFRAACRTAPDSPSLPWDLLIVDEAHNLAPAPFGEESDLAKLLGQLAPLFEHKVFLTATPHNGHTRSFSGLLERLDPVRFTRTAELSAAERGRVEQVLVRRLKREVDERAEAAGRERRFARRSLRALPVRFGPDERALAEAFQRFRARIYALVASERRREQVAGTFAVEILGKRLLSSPVSFADSWWRTLEGIRHAAPAADGDGAGHEAAGATEVAAARRAVEDETGDDRETEGRIQHAAVTVGAWLARWSGRLEEEIRDVSTALGALGLEPGASPADARPRSDARAEALFDWIDARLRDGEPRNGMPSQWRDDERLVLFTEYKTTLDTLTARLRARYGDPAVEGASSAIRTLYGGMDPAEREEIKAAFNDPESPVRVLVATDAASEGLNLQETARYMLHVDVPWNPSRLEQRNGRLDRHGQARDVEVFHFTSDDDADLRFLAKVVEKVESIREDLGSAGEVFDRAIEARLLEGRDAEGVIAALERDVNAARGRADVPRDDSAVVPEEAEGIAALRRELDLDERTLQATMDVALGVEVGRPRLEPLDDDGRTRFVHPVPGSWRQLVDEALRLRGRGDSRGALPKLVFDPVRFVRRVNGRPVYRPARDAALLHLAHPVYRRVLGTFARARFDVAADGAVSPLTRWTFRRGPVPEGAAAVLLVTVEELATNELRETFHHWVRTLRLPILAELDGEAVVDAALGEPLPHRPASEVHAEIAAVTPAGWAPTAGDVALARALWEVVERDVKRFARQAAESLTRSLTDALDREREQELARENDRFRSRQGELSSLIEQQTLRRLEREIEERRAAEQQFDLLLGDARSEGPSAAELEEELSRRQEHYQQLRGLLERERDRVTRLLVPKRFTLRGDARVFPVAVELVLPAAGAPAAGGTR